MICFIGGGIASLYAAYKLLQNDNTTKIIILEKNKRLGGRIHNAKFHGVEIPEGAGIGRFAKDKLLKQLMRELEIPIKTFFCESQALGFEKVDVINIINQLKTAAHKYDRSSFTFSQFARAELGERLYKRFKNSVGYTDFENADIIDTLYHYGFEDTQGIKCFYVPWNLLISKLVDKIKDRVTIITGYIVKSIDHVQKQFKCKQIIIGTAISTLRKLLKHHNIYNHIHSQPFMRIYALVDGMDKKINKTTLVKNDLQKIIPMTNNVYMIAYADNQKAVSLLKHAHDPNYLSTMLKVATNTKTQPRVKDIHVKYWPEGTHYYSPLPKEYKTRKEFIEKVQHPKNNLSVIGEICSYNYQGWVEGALESVMYILKANN